MITYFTTTKDFTGPADNAQENAIQSWLHSVDGAEVIIFGESKGLDRFESKEGIHLHPMVKTSGEGTPRIDDMFLTAQSIASHQVCCFINADIIITNKFARSVLAVHDRIRSCYLIAGQRYDVRIDHFINFSEAWEPEIERLISSSGRHHPPFGSDFFAFPKNQYGRDDIPELLVGRGGWDLWMIYDGRKRGMKVIDLSPTDTVIHQDHDYSHRKNGFVSYDHDPEARHNIRHIPAGETYPYTLMACNYTYKDGRFRRNFARGHLKWFLSYELHLRKNRSPFKEIRSVLKWVKLVR